VCLLRPAARAIRWLGATSDRIIRGAHFHSAISSNFPSCRCWGCSKSKWPPWRSTCWRDDDRIPLLRPATVAMRPATLAIQTFSQERPIQRGEREWNGRQRRRKDGQHGASPPDRIIHPGHHSCDSSLCTLDDWKCERRGPCKSEWIARTIGGPIEWWRRGFDVIARAFATTYRGGMMKRLCARTDETSGRPINLVGRESAPTPFMWSPTVRGCHPIKATITKTAATTTSPLGFVVVSLCSGGSEVFVWYESDGQTC
jgi:hypothetical protein